MSRTFDLARRAVSSLAFRVVMTLALMTLVVSRVDWQQISDRIGSGHPGYGVLAVLSIATALVLNAFRWSLLLRAADVSLSGRELFRIYAVTSFANAFLPTAVGGDVARPLMVSRRGSLLVRAIVTVFTERVAALAALIVLAWYGVATQSAATSDGVVGALSAASAGVLVVALAVGLRPARVRELSRPLIPARLTGHMGEAAACFGSLVRARGTLAWVGLLSLASQALIAFQLVLLAKAIGVDLSFGLAAVALTLVTLATLLPISIGGFGVREGSYVAILAGGGIGRSDALLLSLLTVVALFFATLPGAVELIRGGFSATMTEVQP